MWFSRQIGMLSIFSMVKNYNCRVVIFAIFQSVQLQGCILRLQRLQKISKRTKYPWNGSQTTFLTRYFPLFDPPTLQSDLFFYWESNPSESNENCLLRNALVYLANQPFQIQSFITHSLANSFSKLMAKKQKLELAFTSMEQAIFKGPWVCMRLKQLQVKTWSQILEQL